MLPRWLRSLSRPHRSSSFRPRSLAHRLCLEALENRVLLTTYTVTTTADSGDGSLRQMIMDSNSNGGPNEIRFSIGSGVQTINLLSELPAITTPVTIDGTSQPGSGNTPRIELNGSGAGSGANGLHITAGERPIKWLSHRAVRLNLHICHIVASVIFRRVTGGQLPSRNGSGRSGPSRVRRGLCWRK